jgi:hypothetical protein
MHFTVDISWASVFSVLTFSGSVAALTLSLMLKKKQETLEESCQTCLEELKALADSALGLGKRLVELENEMQKLTYTQQKMSFNDPMRSSYNQAAALLKKGADVEEVMGTCEISRAEAELIMRMGLKVDAASGI